MNCLALYQLCLQSATQEASEDDDPTTEVFGDVSKSDTTTVFTNETQIEVPWIKKDASLQNGPDKQQEDATRNQSESQKTTDKKHKKSNFGGMKKGFLL